MTLDISAQLDVFRSEVMSAVPEKLSLKLGTLERIDKKLICILITKTNSACHDLIYACHDLI